MTGNERCQQHASYGLYSILTKRNHSLSIIDAAVTRISSDHTSGAAEILSRAGDVFSLLDNHGSEFGIIDLESAYRTILETCVAISNAQQDMSPLLRLASAALSAAQDAATPTEALKFARDAALDFIETSGRANRAVVSQAAALIHERAAVLTHSRSSTVLAALLEAKRAGRSFVVIATESRPMLEGRSLAASLSGEGINVTLIADSAVALALSKVDIVLLGADKLTPRDVINKIGTRLIALAARERNLPVYVLCDTSKFISKDYYETAREMKHPGELWKDPPRGVEPENSYFEPTPIEFFAGIVTEDGLLAADEARHRAESAAIHQELADSLLR
jgi:translation initiation factor 2B subunit (eIF-2B alpha/beta/delta family)